MNIGLNLIYDMTAGKKTYITTPIYYVNDKPHIGHFYTSLLSDGLIRFSQKNCLQNGNYTNEVLYLTGIDEHGQKVQKSAQNKGISSQAYCDEMSQYFKDLISDFELIFSENNFANGTNFIRTTSTCHKQFVQKVWQEMLKNGWIYLSKYKGYYAQRDEAFYEESELIDGKAPTGADVEFKEEDCYFFRLSYFKNVFLTCTQDAKFKNRQKLTFLPENKVNEINSFIKDELKDLPVSRIIKKNETGEIIFNWGIPVPNIENQVMYVWLDALFNYMSGIGIKLGILQDNKEVSNADFAKIIAEFKNLNSIHIIGKEILRFHGLYWPAFLFAIENIFTQPFEEESTARQNEICNNFINSAFSQLIIHGWWTNEGQKISKSTGNIISPYQEIQWLQEEFQIEKSIAIDYFKFFLLCSFSCTSDCDYSRKALVEFVNSNLVNNIGNLVNRNIAMYNKIEFTEEDKTNIKSQLNEDFNNIKSEKSTKGNDFFIEGHFYKNLIAKFSFLNELVDKEKPWEMIKNKENTKLWSYFNFMFGSISSILKDLAIFCPFIATEFENAIINKESKIITKRLSKNG